MHSDKGSFHQAVYGLDVVQVQLGASYQMNFSSPGWLSQRVILDNISKKFFEKKHKRMGQ